MCDIWVRIHNLSIFVDKWAAKKKQPELGWCKYLWILPGWKIASTSIWQTVVWQEIRQIDHNVLMYPINTFIGVYSPSITHKWSDIPSEIFRSYFTVAMLQLLPINSIPAPRIPRASCLGQQVHVVTANTCKQTAVIPDHYPFVCCVICSHIYCVFIIC